MDNGDPPQIENAEEKEEEPYEEESAPYVKDAARQDNFPLQLDQKNFDRDKPIVHYLSDMWSICRKDKATCQSIPIGLMYAGVFVPYPKDLDLLAVTTIFMHHRQTYTVKCMEQYRLFVKVIPKKKPPYGYTVFQDIGILYATNRFSEVYGSNGRGKVTRFCYEFREENEHIGMYMRPLLSTRSLVKDLSQAEAQIKAQVSNSNVCGCHSPLAIWNYAIVNSVPHLKKSLIELPRQRWNIYKDEFKNEHRDYIEDSLTGSDTCSDSEYESDHENPVNNRKNKERAKKRPFYTEANLKYTAMFYSSDKRERPREERLKLDFARFYDKLAVHRKKPPRYTLSLDRLTCYLRPYQIEAVEFMLHRELQTELKFPKDIFTPYKLDGGLNYYSNFGVFSMSDEPPKLKVTGGILADEMGLGKTVELLGLIFSLRPDNFAEMEAQSKIACSNEPPRVLEIDPIKECVEFLVGSVAAQEDGIRGLNAILKSKLVRPDARNKNVYFNVNSRHYVKYKNIDHLEKIRCSECGISCLKEKMHWRDEFDAEGIPFVCPDCVYAGDILPSGATLIVVPQVLLHQWYEEIKKHVREDVLVDMYLGVEREGFKHPVYLSRCEIVLTSYETLRHELEYTQPGTIFNLRKRTYDQQRQVTTPLISINWWRICLDESQIIEGWASMASKMCSKLTGRARWCVTGTPLVHGPDDLYGLVCFLDLYPFTIRNVWLSQLLIPFEQRKRNTFYKFISSFFWRHSMKSVQNQLNLPPITYQTHEMHFSPLEERLYQEQLADSLGQIRNYLAYRPHYRSMKIVELPHDVQNTLMSFFNQLRLFILTGGAHVKKKNKQSTSNVVYSNDLLFKRLFASHRVKLEEKIREYMYSVCALGGLYLLYKPEQAEACYLRMRKVEEDIVSVNRIFNKHLLAKQLQIDNTQAAHVYKALIDLYKGENPKTNNEEATGILKNEKPQMSKEKKSQLAKEEKSRSSNNENKRWELNELKEKLQATHDHYVRREIANLKKLYADWNEVQEDWRKCGESLDDSTSWILVYLDALSSAQLHDLKDWALQTDMDIAQDIQNIWDEYRQWTFPYRLFFYCKENVERQSGNIEEVRRKINGFAFPYNEELDQFMFDMESGDMTSMMECYHNKIYIDTTTEFGEEDDEDVMFHPIGRRSEEDPLARRVKGKKLVVEKDYTCYNCPLCELEKYTKKLEKTLYMTDGVKRLPMHLNEWYAFFKELATKHRIGYQYQKAKLWKWFEQSRKVVLLSHKIIVAMKELICRFRELKQSEERLTYGLQIDLPGFLAAKIPLTEEPTQQMEMAMERWKNRTYQLRNEMDSMYTQINYICTLGRIDIKDRMCPVCLDDLAISWNVFPCAHCICINCFGRLRSTVIARSAHDNARNNEKQIHVDCVVCRSTCLVENVIHVVLQPPQNKEEIPGFNRGELNVKYDETLRQLIKVLKMDITNKVLIFTSLLECLESFCSVLEKAGIRFNRLYSLDPLKIANFRNDPNIRVLVISLHAGANGLNLTQANNIFFLEPTVEKATVAQAIGRMARMGQYRPMTVHNFVVRGSIEEEIDRLLNDVVSSNGWTVGKLESILAGAASAAQPEGLPV